MGESFYLFSLPDDEYWDMKFAKRINPEGSQSPPSMPHLISGPSLEDIRAVRRHSTVEDTDGKECSKPEMKISRLTKFFRSSLIASLGSWTQGRSQHSSFKGYSDFTSSGGLDPERRKR